MYDENEKLVLVESYGKKDSEKYLPEGTEVEFIKVIHNDNDLAQSLVAVRVGEERIVVMKEANVKPVDEKKIKNEFKDFQKNMMLNNPRLRVYHPNFFARIWFRVYYFFKDRYGK